MRTEVWNYQVWKAFNQKLFSESINADDVLENGAELFYETIWKITPERGVVEFLIEPEELRDVILVQKGNTRYVLPKKFAALMPLKPTETFECQIKKSDKKKWLFVTSVNSLNIKGDPFDLTPAMFIDQWNNLKHSNPLHWKLMKMIALAANHKGTKACICSVPSFGKNSNFTVMNTISNNNCRIQKPTLAKLETVLYYNKVVLPDEMTSLETAKIKEIEGTFLWLADDSPDYNKHSMAQNKLMNQIDITQKSIVFTYNRKCDLQSKGVFFDQLWSNVGAFRSRYPQLLLTGTVEEVMPKLNPAQSKKIMEDNFEDMRKMAKAYIHFSHELAQYFHHYAMPDDFLKLSNRHKTNLQGLVDVIDACSVSQEEFEYWINVVLDCMREYKKQNGEGHSEEPMKIKEIKVNVNKIQEELI
jgi:hypothetical protein